VTGEIAVINPYTGPNWDEPGVVSTIKIGGQPGDIVITPSGAGYCIAWGDGTRGFLYKYDALADTVIRGADNPIFIGPNVSSLEYDPSEDVLWIPYMKEWGGDGFVQKFDIKTDTIISRHGVFGAGSQAVAVLESIFDSDPGADAVYSFSPGSNWSRFGENYYPDNVLGPPDPGPGVGVYSPTIKPQEVLSLGHGGEIVLQFIDNIIVDGEGPDLTVFENPFISLLDGSVNIEAAMVSISQNGTDWLSFPYDTVAMTGLAGVTPTADNTRPTDPAISGGDQFDLGDLGLSWAAFVKLTDMGDLYRDVGDFDLDAVVAINSGEGSTGIVTEEEHHPEIYHQLQNYPNPFNAMTAVEFNMPKPQHASLDIYDIAGRRVRNLMSMRLPAGHHRILWDGRDDSGSRLGSGLYLARLRTNEIIRCCKMTLIK
jgi:hypothetical protein